MGVVACRPKSGTLAAPSYPSPLSGSRLPGGVRPRASTGSGRLRRAEWQGGAYLQVTAYVISASRPRDVPVGGEKFGFGCSEEAPRQHSARRTAAEQRRPRSVERVCQTPINTQCYHPQRAYSSQPPPHWPHAHVRFSPDSSHQKPRTPNEQRGVLASTTKTGHT